MVDSFVSLTVDAVAVPNAVVGNADVILADGAVFPLVVSTNNVGASAEDSVVLDVLPVVVFTSLISVKGDDASVICAAVVGANVDSVVPDDLNVVIPADEEPLLASVVGSCVTLVAVVETSEVRATVSGFTDNNVVVSFWAEEDPVLSGSLLIVAAVVLPIAVVGSADVAPVDVKIVALIASVAVKILCDDGIFVVGGGVSDADTVVLLIVTESVKDSVVT